MAGGPGADTASFKRKHDPKKEKGKKNKSSASCVTAKDHIHFWTLSAEELVGSIVKQSLSPAAALASHDYILKIVPTVYEDLSGRQRFSYQYTVANKVLPRPPTLLFPFPALPHERLRASDSPNIWGEPAVLTRALTWKRKLGTSPPGGDWKPRPSLRCQQTINGLLRSGAD